MKKETCGSIVVSYQVVMLLPKVIKDLINKYVLAIQHPNVQLLENARNKIWNELIGFSTSSSFHTLVHKKQISFYPTIDNGHGSHVMVPGSQIIVPYCGWCGSMIIVNFSWYKQPKLPRVKIRCTCTGEEYLHLPWNIQQLRDLYGDGEEVNTVNACSNYIN